MAPEIDGDNVKTVSKAIFGELLESERVRPNAVDADDCEGIGVAPLGDMQLHGGNLPRCFRVLVVLGVVVAATLESFREKFGLESPRIVVRIEVPLAVAEL